MVSSVIFVLFVLNFINFFQTPQAALFGINNLEQNLGEECDLGNDMIGYCEELSKCPSAKKLFHSGKNSEIKLCKFIGRMPFVCCPNKATKPKSSKFEKALCKNTFSPLKLQIHVYNGQDTAIEDFPFQVALGYRQDYENDITFNCGGSLIADDIVLTAAHCVNRKYATPIMVRLGRTSLDLNDPDETSVAQDIEIERIEMHSGYSKRSRQNDIALIKLKKPAELTESVQTVCLSTKDYDTAKKYTITGYGSIDSYSQIKSNKLLKGTVNEYSFEKCKTLVSPAGIKLIDSQFCAHSSSGSDTCQGDSGGPVSYEEKNQAYLQAITSFGVKCGSGYPGIYTRVNKYLDWIEEKMALLE